MIIQKPDQLPARFPFYGHNDIHHVRWNQIGTGDSSKPHTLDEWGCTWSRTQVKNMGIVTGHPLENLETIGEPKFLHLLA